MAITLAQLKTQVRNLADQNDSEFITDAELLFFINESYGSLYDMLINVAEDYFLSTANFSLSQSGTTTYSLPSTFYKLRGIDKVFSVNEDENIPLFKYNFNERHKYSSRYNRIYDLRETPVYRVMGNTIYFEPLSAINGDYKIYYIPKYTALVNDADQINENCDIWNQYIIVDAAIKCLTKEESDVSVLMNMKNSLIQRIQSSASNRDAGRAERVSDVTGGYFLDEWDNY